MPKKNSEQDVLNILTRLKGSEGNYPSDMIQSRRDSFAKQAAAMAVLARAGLKSTTTTGSGQAAATSSTASTTNTIIGASMGKLLETALVVAIAAEAGVAGYIYRDKIADFFNSILNPKVEVAPSPLPSNILPTEEFSTETPEGIAAETETPIPSVTVLPTIENNGNNTTNNNSGATPVVSTPAPTDDTPGLHLGQTKQPSSESNINKKE